MSATKRFITFKFKATDGINVLNQSHQTGCDSYADAMDELLDYLEDFFKGGFDLTIQGLRIYSDKYQ